MSPERKDILTERIKWIRLSAQRKYRYKTRSLAMPQIYTDNLITVDFINKKVVSWK